MAPKYHPTPLSGGDRKALAKELGKSRAMANILAAQSAEMRAKGEALVQQADKHLCESWNERMWSDGDQRENELARSLHRPRHAQSVARIHAGQFRQGGRILLLDIVDNREVRADRIRKSVGAENTFSSDLTNFEAMVAELQPLIDKVWRHCGDKGTRGRTVTLKVKFNDFDIITRSRSLPVAVSSRAELERVSVALLQNETPFSKPVRLLGISLSSLQSDDQAAPQLGLPI